MLGRPKASIMGNNKPNDSSKDREARLNACVAALRADLSELLANFTTIDFTKETAEAEVRVDDTGLDACAYANEGDRVWAPYRHNGRAIYLRCTVIAAHGTMARVSNDRFQFTSSFDVRYLRKKRSA